MAQDFNIKISELDPIYSGSIRNEDFFPLVHSQSMTTFRATLLDIGKMITHSIFADTASYIANATRATSASHADWADTSSYAISASHALLADSASYYPPQQFQASTLYASRSHDALYATRALDVDTHGPLYNFPYWTSDTPGAGNGNLKTNSPLVFYPYSGDLGLLVSDSGSTHGNPYQVYPNHRPDVYIYRYGDRANVAWGFAPNIGIQTTWPITSQTFVGTDQRDWYFSTASNPHPPFDPDLMVTNSYFSGSAGGGTSGSFYTIPDAPGAMASIFNGKWVRFAASLGNPSFYDDTVLPGTNPPLPDHPPHGVFWSNQDQRMYGLISLQLQTTVYTGGSNAWNQIDFWFHQGQWGGGISAQVFHVNSYGPQLIRAIRFHSTNGIKDPPMFIDLLIDGLYSGGEAPGYLGEPVLTIKAQSWHGVRFLKWLNVNPWPLQDTGSSDITQDGTTLIVPAAPGFYTNAPKSLNYNIQGQNVAIWPTYNQITQSGLAVPATVNSRSLFVSGGINTNEAYYCDNNRGLTTKVTYGSTNLYFSGGILIRKEPPDGPVVPSGTPCGTSLKFNGGLAMPNETYITLGSATGPVIVHFDAYANPDRLQVWMDGAVVYDTGYRGDPADKSIRDAGLTAAGSGSETSSPIISPGQTTFTWYKSSATTQAKVQVFAPGAGTAWNYTMSCPNQPLPT